MGLCDAHTANCWAAYEAAWRREEMVADREEWESAIDKVSDWRGDWDSFLHWDQGGEPQRLTVEEVAKVTAFIAAVDAWLEEHGEYRQWFAGAHTRPQEPVLAGRNTPVFPEDEAADPNAEIPT